MCSKCIVGRYTFTDWLHRNTPWNFALYERKINTFCFLPQNTQIPRHAHEDGFWFLSGVLFPLPSSSQACSLVMLKMFQHLTYLDFSSFPVKLLRDDDKSLIRFSMWPLRFSFAVRPCGSACATNFVRLCINQLVKKWINKKIQFSSAIQSQELWVKFTWNVISLTFDRISGISWDFQAKLELIQDAQAKIKQTSSENQVRDSETSCWWERSEEKARRMWADRSHSVRRRWTARHGQPSGRWRTQAEDIVKVPLSSAVNRNLRLQRAYTNSHLV